MDYLDEMAGKTLQALLANTEDYSGKKIQQVAEMSYYVAEQMLLAKRKLTAAPEKKVRNKKQPGHLPV